MQSQRGLTSASPGAVQHPLAPTLDIPGPHWGCGGPQDPSRPGPAFRGPRMRPTISVQVQRALWLRPAGP